MFSLCDALSRVALLVSQVDQHVWALGAWPLLPDLFIYGDEAKIKKVIREFLNDGITNLAIPGIGALPQISAEDILTLAAKCPNLQTLKVNSVKIGSWPRSIDK